MNIGTKIKTFQNGIIWLTIKKKKKNLLKLNNLDEKMDENAQITDG